ncbi:MAG TPA: thioredoxin family protein [Mycobacteriales bacterium]|nr:thioredoxin family protein [Mycobacteriales bacterium]
MDRRQFLLLSAIGAGAPILAGCSSDDDPAEPAKESKGGASLQDIAPDAAKGLQLLDAQPELVVGTSRYSFGLLDPDGKPLTDADVTLYAGPDPAGRAQATVPATWLQGGVADKAIYVAQVPFTKAGPYFLAAVAKTKEGARIKGGVQVQVAATSASPLPGQPAISVPTPVASRLDGADPLCSRKPVCTMHEVSLDAALAGGKPVVVTFSAPAFCATETCGPVVDIVEAQKQRGDTSVTYVHVEAYRKKGAELAPALKAWKFATEPWTYIVDAKGVVVDRLAGAIGAEELTAAVAKL